MAEKRKGASNPVAIGCVAIFFSPLWATGVWAIIQALRTGQILPGVIGATLFIAGLMPIVWVILSIRSRPEREAFYKEIRATPAEWKPEWSAGRLQDQTVETASVINVMTIFLTAVSLPFGFFGWVAVREGSMAGLFLLIVPLLVVAFVIAKIRGSMRRKRFGKSDLLLEETPARIGETLRGNIIVEKLRPQEVVDKTFNVSLSSIRRRTWTERYHGSPSQRSESTILWTLALEVPASAAQLKEDGLWLPVAIDIPRDQQATNDALTNDFIYWQLEAMASLPGTDYYSSFETPVFVR